MERRHLRRRGRRRPRSSSALRPIVQLAQRSSSWPARLVKNLDLQRRRRRRPRSSRPGNPWTRPRRRNFHLLRAHARCRRTGTCGRASTRRRQVGLRRPFFRYARPGGCAPSYPRKAATTDGAHPCRRRREDSESRARPFLCWAAGVVRDGRDFESSLSSSALNAATRPPTNPRCPRRG